MLVSNLLVNRGQRLHQLFVRSFATESTAAPSSGLSLTFLGTGHECATKERALPSLLLQFAGGAILFDAGEGTLTQLQKSGVSPRRLDYLFISHLHSDHLWGLPAVITDINKSRFSGQLPRVWGPVGSRRYLDTVFLAAGGLPRRSLCFVNEFHFPGMLRSNPLRADSKREADRDFLPLKTGPKDVWPAGKFAMPDREQPFTVTAALLQHDTPSFGYVIQEPDRLVEFVPEKAKELGVPAGVVWNTLESGKTVKFSDQTVTPHQVFKVERGRKIVLLGDNGDASKILPIARDADVVVHDATLPHTEKSATTSQDFSTARMALQFGAATNAKHLFLTHFSAAVKPEKELLDAQAHINFSGRVHVANDLQTFEIPSTGDIQNP